ncbi:hypothetical protein GQ457_17G004350 [Hibiscus cannabinus]
MATPPQKTNKGGTNSSAGNSNGQQVKFARRTSSGRYVSLSREDMDMSGELSGDYMNYTVHIPPTPDNQPMDNSIASKAEEQYVSNSLFTGGFNSVTRAHLMDKVIDSEVTHPQMAGAKGGSCAMKACDGKVMKDERGEDITPCACRFKICRDCYMDAQKDKGLCPGCKESYKVTDYDDEPGYSSGTLKLPAPGGKKDNMSMMKTGGDFDHNRWLFETSGTYGYGNAFRDDYGDGGDERLQGDLETNDKPWKPLSRVIPIKNSIISPYRYHVRFFFSSTRLDPEYNLICFVLLCRLLIFTRLVVLGFFLHWRVVNPNNNAIWLWLMSIICEIWFAFSWILDQIPKLCPINRSTDLEVLREKFDLPSPSNPTGRSDLPGIDFFVSTADPEKEPPLTTANTILSILAVDYPVEKVACYVSDDGGALLTFEAMAEACSFADLWVPFCRKHDIEPRNPDAYFNLKGDPTKGKSRPDFVKDRRRVKREYEEFKVRINGLPDAIRRRSEAFNAREEMKVLKHMRETGADPMEKPKVQKATWMADGSHWPGTWNNPSKEHSKGDHAGILQVMLKPPSHDPLTGGSGEDKLMSFVDVDIRLPMLVYMSREKRPGYDHNKKAGAMNALVRSSAILSNGPFILNLDCDHYINNCRAIREGMCFMMDRGGEDICYIQFPQRFEGIDPSDRYANHNTVFFDGNMRALDGVQGPVYVGTGCMFRRFALYAFDPPNPDKMIVTKDNETQPLAAGDFDPNLDVNLLPKQFGNSTLLAESIPVAEFQGRPLADHPAIKFGRPPGALRVPREPLDAVTVGEAVSVISCWYEDKTEWGERVGWIYGSVTEDVVTGFRMHNRGWRADQPYGSTPPSAPMGDRLRRDLLLQKQRLARNLQAQIPSTISLFKRRHIPFHFNVPHRLLLPPGNVTHLRPVHRPRAQHLVLGLPHDHHLLPHRLGTPRGKMGRNRIRRMVEKRAVLAHFRDQLSLRSMHPRSSESDRRHRDILHTNIEISRRGRGRHIRGPVLGEMDIVDDPADRDRVGEHRGTDNRLLEDTVRQRAVEHVHRRSVLRVVGAVPSVSVRKRVDGEATEDADHSVRVGGAHLHNHSVAVDGAQPRQPEFPRKQ